MSEINQALEPVESVESMDPTAVRNWYKDEELRTLRANKNHLTALVILIARQCPDGLWLRLADLNTVQGEGWSLIEIHDQFSDDLCLHAIPPTGAS